MQTKSDAQLLRDYATRGAEAAFTELVHRHTSLVYSAALRQVDSPEAAAEIAQNVFLGLARDARALTPRLAPEASLAGWLCRSARNLSLNFRRDEFRRHARERQVMQELISIPDDAPDWERLRRVLDDAMSELSETDYDALVLRFYQNQDFRNVGAALGVSDDTAQKRVARALEKLRELLSRHGIRTTAAALSVVITANAVQAAPLGLALTISSAALAGAAISTSTIIAATKTIAMTTLQKTLVTATVAVLAGAGFYEARQAAQLREQNQSLQQQRALLAEQNQQLRQEHDNALSKLANVEQQTTPSPESATELLKLRAEVTRLKGSERELAHLKAATAATGNGTAIDAALKSWAIRATQLKQRLELIPEKGIPELHLLTEKDWFDAIKNTKRLETDADYRKALSNLRNNAKNTFGDLTREAIKKYAEANNGMLPGELSQLKPYYETPVTDAMLARYALQQSGKLADTPPNEYLVAEKAAPVDDEFDSHYEFSINGTRSSSVNDPGDIVLLGLEQFAKAHNGNLPADASQLRPYLPQPLDQAKVQEILVQIPSGVTTMEQLKAAGPK